MRHRLTLLFTAVILIALCCLPAEKVFSATALKVDIYENSPKIFTDKNGTTSRFWPRLLKRIAAQEGWQIDYVPGTWQQGLDRLAKHEIGLLPDVAFSAARAERYDFTKQTVLLSWSQVYAAPSVKIQTILDLQNKKIGVLKNSINYDGVFGIKDLIDRFDMTCIYCKSLFY